MDTTSSGLPNPISPVLPGVFGFTANNPDVTGISSALDQGKAVLGLLQSHINQHVVDTVANAAVTSDMLRGSVAYDISGKLANAAQTAAVLQQPIQQQIIGTMGSTIENTIPLGVNPPTQATIGTLPFNVQIRQGAMQQNYAPAVSYYLANGGQQGLPLGQQQLSARQFILDAVSGIPGAANAIQQQLQDVDITAGHANLASVSVSNPVINPTLSAGQNTNILQQSVSSGMQNVATQVAGMGQQSTGTQSTAVSQSVTTTATPPPFCVLPKDLSTDINNPTQCPNGVSQQAIDYWAALHTTAELDAIAATASTNGSGFSGLAGYVGLGVDYRGFKIVQALYIGTRGTCSLGIGTAVYGYHVIWGNANSNQAVSTGCIPWTNTTQQQQQQTTTTTTTTCPPPTCCPPPVINVTCPPPKDCPPPPPPDKYCMYCTSGGTFYVIKDTDPPRDSSDTSVACGDPKEWNLSKIFSTCGEQQQTEQQQFTNAGDFTPFPTEILGCQEFNVTPGVTFPNGLASLGELLGVSNRDGTPLQMFDEGTVGPVASAIGNILVSFISTVANQFGSVANALVSQSGCATGQQFALMGTDIILKLWQQYIGNSLDTISIPNDQQRHYLCPTVLPSAQEAGIAYLGDQIGKDTLECWARADNKRWPEYATVVDAQRSKFSPLQLAIALRRQLITNDQYAHNVREAGYIRDMDAQLAYDLTAQIPPPGDLVRLMVRDAADEPLVLQFELDKQFGDKFTGKIKEWADAQGVDADYMKMIWRAHWEIPSPGQLYVMLHRLSRLPQNDPNYVDINTVKTALNQQDIAPFWVDKFIATSYNPLTRIDARRAFEIGAIGEQTLRNAYLDLGYNQDNADVLVEYNKKNITRTMLRRPEIKELARGEITANEFEQTMTMWGASDTAVQAGFSYAAMLRQKNARTLCVKAIKKRYMGGDLSRAETELALTQQGLDGTTAHDLASGWQCERVSKSKEISAAQAMSLYQDGIISEYELVRRLQNVGYSNDDAVMLVRQQARRLGIKVAKDELSKMRQEQAEQLRLQKKVEQQAKAADAASRRASAQLRKLQQQKEMREKRLIEAGLKYAEHVGVSIPDGVRAVKALYLTVLNNYTVTFDEAVQAILLVAQDKQVTTADEFVSAVTTGLATIG